MFHAMLLHGIIQEKKKKLNYYIKQKKEKINLKIFIMLVMVKLLPLY